MYLWAGLGIELHKVPNFWYLDVINNVITTSRNRTMFSEYFSKYNIKNNVRTTKAGIDPYNRKKF